MPLVLDVIAWSVLRFGENKAYIAAVMDISSTFRITSILGKQYWSRTDNQLCNGTVQAVNGAERTSGRPGWVGGQNEQAGGARQETGETG